MKKAPGGLLLPAAAAILLAVFAYFPALDGDFISDDKFLVAGNPATRSPGAALSAFTSPYWHGLKPVNPYYRPLPLLSYAVDRSRAGDSTTLFHLTNVAIHALNGILAAWLVAGLSRARGGARDRTAALRAPGVASGMLLAAALVAVHPLHSEPVAAIYGRPDLLACAGALLFLNLAIRGRPVLAALAMLAGLLSKESVLLIPLLAPAAFAAGAGFRSARPRGRGREAASAGQRAAGAALTGSVLAVTAGGLYLWLRHVALGSFLEPAAVDRLDNPLAAAGTMERWLTPFSVAARGAALWLWPSRLCADRGFNATPMTSGPGDPHFAAGVILLGSAIALLGILAARRSPWALPVAAALMGWLPGSGLIVVSPALMAERFLYTASVLACVLAGGLLAAAAGRSRVGEDGEPGRCPGRAAEGRPWLPQAVLLLLCAAVVALLAGRTFVRAGAFTSDLTFHAADVAACPGSAKAHYNLGNALSRAGRHQEAARSFRRAGQIAPWLGVAHANEGASLLRLGRLEEARAAYRAALEADPDLVTARASLAGVLYLSGRLEEALDQAQTALEMDPAPGDAAQIRELIARIRAALAGAREAPEATSRD